MKSSKTKDLTNAVAIVKRLIRTDVKVIYGVELFFSIGTAYKFHAEEIAVYLLTTSKPTLFQL